MGKGSSDAPSPDPNIGKAALLQAKTGEDWLAFSKDAFATSTERQKGVDALTSKVVGQQLDTATQQAKWAQDAHDRYVNIFQPLQDQMVDEATNYDTPEKQAAAAATAKADVESQAASEKQASLRQSTAMGINPASGRGMGIAKAAEMGTGLASAGAQNQARDQVKQQGIAMRGNAINIGMGLPAQAGASAGLGLNAGQSAAGLTGANQQLSNSSYGIVGQGYSGAMQGYAGEASTLNSLYQSQLAQWNANQNASASAASGIGSIVGAGIGMFMSSKKVKTKKAPIKDGAGLDAVNKMPVESWQYKKGVADEGQHVGPYAEDMQKATGLGNGKQIAAQDAIGISMKAIQDLSKKIDRTDQKVVQLTKAIGITAPKKPAPRPAAVPMKKAA